MGCNNANTAKCAACYRGGVDPADFAEFDQAAKPLYNGKERRKRQAKKNAKAHKAYHIRRMING